MEISHQAMLVLVRRVSDKAKMAATNCSTIEISSAIFMGMGSKYRNELSNIHQI
jgi:hypothetical protein